MEAQITNEQQEAERLWSFLTQKEIQKLREREAYRSSVTAIKARVRKAKGNGFPKNLQRLAEKLGYNEYYLYQAFSKKHVASGRYYWTALFRCLQYLRLPIPEILHARYEKFKEQEEADGFLREANFYA